jgi:hypothetical protein
VLVSEPPSTRGKCARVLSTIVATTPSVTEVSAPTLVSCEMLRRMRWILFALRDCLVDPRKPGIVVTLLLYNNVADIR